MSIAEVDIARLLGLLGQQDLNSLQIVDAAHLAGQSYPQIDPGQPVLIVGLTGAGQLAIVGERLAPAYPIEHLVQIITDEGAQERRLDGLSDADRHERVECLFVPPLPHPAAYTALQEIVARLRAPDGCPWDRELTWEKLRASLLEEAHELLAALDAGDVRKVMEEQGDVLLQVALQAQIATEQGMYRSAEVIGHIVEKLVRRHPHVFGDEQLNTPQEVLANWEAIKRAERARNGEVRSPLAGIPAALPALAQAEAYLDRIARLRTLEVPEAPWSGLAAQPAGTTVTAEGLGEALFGLVAWARVRGLEAESALRATNARYAAAVAASLADQA